MKDSHRISPVITLLTDFGMSDGYVAAIKGVILSVAPQVRIVDAGHLVSAQDIDAAAFALAQYWSLYPKGAIHLVVVDPGVGTERAALIAEADGHIFVAPDNGVLALVAGQAEVFHARRIHPGWHRPGGYSATFHGRDVFAYAAALLAAGKTPVASFSDPVDEIDQGCWREAVVEGDCIAGNIIHQDRFGNLITNIRYSVFEKTGWTAVHAEAGGYVFEHISRTYADVPVSEKLALFDSAGFLELALRNGSAARRLGLRRGEPVFLRRNRKESAPVATD